VSLDAILEVAIGCSTALVLGTYVFVVRVNSRGQMPATEALRPYEEPFGFACSLCGAAKDWNQASFVTSKSVYGGSAIRRSCRNCDGSYLTRPKREVSS
jgi:hypothetical protein